MNWKERVSVDPMVCHGQACVKVAFQNRLARAGESYVKIPDASAAELPGIVGPNAIESAAGATDWGQSAKTPSVSPPAT
jgi:hypothetical protein